MILQGVLLTLLAILYPRGVCSTHSCGRQLAISKIINFVGSELGQGIENKENYLFSPLSITVALAMVYVGTRGTTREQMADVLEFKMAGKNCLSTKISRSIRDLISTLENEGTDYTFLIANGAFIQKTCTISPHYTSNLLKFFNSNISYQNFEQEETSTMNAINTWVSNHTNAKVPKLLNEPLDPLTVMVLVNAVYFKGLWRLQFDDNDTTNSSFFRINDSDKIVPFMSLQGRVNYYFDAKNNYSFLELQYEGRNISMIIALPNEVEMPKLVLTNDVLCDLRENFESKIVNVEIPKFKLEFSRELSKDMKNLGVTELFSENADLSGIREQNDLHVSLMIHKAVIEVNEKGSEAAGMSGVGIDGRVRVSQIENFRANHPFLFYIVHSQTDTVLFSGRVLNP